VASDDERTPTEQGQALKPSTPVALAHRAEYMREWNKSAKAKEYRLRPDVRARANAKQNARRATAGWKRWAADFWAKPETKRAHREYYLKKTYGITVEQYDRMLAEQGGGCAVCGRTNNSKRMTYLSVDHCHATGKVRGLLCNACNVALGFLEEDKVRMVSLMNYISRNNGE